MNKTKVSVAILFFRVEFIPILLSQKSDITQSQKFLRS